MAAQARSDGRQPCAGLERGCRGWVWGRERASETLRGPACADATASWELAAPSPAAPAGPPAGGVEAEGDALQGEESSEGRLADEQIQGLEGLLEPMPAFGGAPTPGNQQRAGRAACALLHVCRGAAVGALAALRKSSARGELPTRSPAFLPVAAAPPVQAHLGATSRQQPAAPGPLLQLLLGPAACV